MGLKDSLFAGNKIICIVFHKGSSLRILDACGHDLHQTHHSRRLPVALGSEAVSFFHQSLHRQSWKLFQRTQITEMGNHSLIIMVLQESLESDLDPCLYCYMTFEFFRVSALKKNVILIIIFFYQNINITLADTVHIFAYFVYRISVHFPAEFDLCLYLVALGNGNISHIIRHTAYADMAALHDTHSGAHPGSQSFLNFSVRPVSDDNLSLDSHTGYDMSVLSSAVSRLVFVHEVHIDGVIGDFLIKLCVQMAQRFSVFLQSQDPGFCR